MSESHDDGRRSTGDDVMSGPSAKLDVSDDDYIQSASLTGLDRTFSGDNISKINISANEITSGLTEKDATRILNNIFHGHINEPDSESLCTIIQTLETTGPNSTSGGGGGSNVNKQQIHDSVGVKQKVQVGGSKTKVNPRHHKVAVLTDWLTNANTIFDTSYKPSTVHDDPVKVAFNIKGQNSDDYKNLKKLHIFLKLLILKTILEKTKIHLKYEHKNRKNELLSTMCVKVNEHYGEFDVAAAMFIIFCGETALKQIGTLAAMSACLYSATYAPQICSLMFKIMQPTADLVSYLFSFGLPTLIAGSFAAKSAVEAIQNFQKSLASTAFPRPPPKPTSFKTKLQMFISSGFKFATDMTPVADATLPKLSNLAQTMFAALMHIKKKATDVVLNKVIHLFLDTFAGSDRIFQIASANPDRFGMLLLEIIEAVETNFPGDGEIIAHNLQSSQFSKFHAIGVVSARSAATPYGGSTTKSPQNMTKSTLKKRFATINKRHNRFRFHVSKNNSRLYKNRHRFLTSKLRKNNK
jgi:hypothetical protein